MTKRLDLRAGENMGRVYRISPIGSKLRRAPNLAGRTTRELVASIESANGWERDTAQRLILERADPSATASLGRLASASPRPVTRLQALWTLHDSGGLSPSAVLKALGDKDARVRAKLRRSGSAEDLPAAGSYATAHRPHSPDSRPALFKATAMTADPAIRVRFQLAFTLGETEKPQGWSRKSAGGPGGAGLRQNEQMRIAILEFRAAPCRKSCSSAPFWLKQNAPPGRPSSSN